MRLTLRPWLIGAAFKGVSSTHWKVTDVLEMGWGLGVCFPMGQHGPMSLDQGNCFHMNTLCTSSTWYGRRKYFRAQSPSIHSLLRPSQQHVWLLSVEKRSPEDVYHAQNLDRLYVCRDSLGTSYRESSQVQNLLHPQTHFVHQQCKAETVKDTRPSWPDIQGYLCLQEEPAGVQSVETGQMVTRGDLGFLQDLWQPSDSHSED